MITTTREIISERTVKETTIRVTVEGTTEIAVLPASVFSVYLSQSKEHDYKRFLCIKYREGIRQYGWINRFSLISEITTAINAEFGKDFIKKCKNCRAGYVGFHFNNDACKQIYVKEQGLDYVILAKITHSRIETEYIPVSE